MSTILCNELISTLSQTVTFNSDKLVRNILGAKPRLVLYNSPSGTFTISFKSGANTFASKSFTSSDIKTHLSTTDNYAYLHYPVEFDEIVNIIPGDYEIVLTSSGYTYSSTSFLGWVKEFEGLFIDRTDAFVDYARNPHSVLLYERVREDLMK